jgi:hypothetical protein
MNTGVQTPPGIAAVAEALTKAVLDLRERLKEGQL